MKLRKGALLRQCSLAYCLETEDKITVVATQSFKEKMSATFVVDGASKLIKTGGIGGYKIDGNSKKINVDVDKDGLIVLVFQKK